MSQPEVNSKEWWDERGVAAEVRDARPYVRWTTDDLEPIRQAYLGLTPSQLNTLLQWGRQSNGLIIYRHSFEGVSTEDPRHVYPEIRPDDAVETDTVWHYHGPPHHESPLHPNSGNPLPDRDVHDPQSMVKHIGRDRAVDDHHGNNSDEVHAHREMAKYLFPPSATGQGIWIHSHQQEFKKRVLGKNSRTPPIASASGGNPANDNGGAPIDTNMCFRKLPDELSPAEAVEMNPTLPTLAAFATADSTAAARQEEQRRIEEFSAWLDDHMRRYHYNAESDSYQAVLVEPAETPTFRTLHLHSTACSLRGEQLAKRVDVNPIVWQHGGFEQAEQVFFVIEGCIKADAIISALLASGQPPAVFSVPSVSLWEATYPAEEDTIHFGDELAAFAHRHLLDKLVCIVPDADAHTKHEVMTQALLCRSVLRKLGAKAEIVLPPDDRLDKGIKGVDDYLGKGGGTLAEMVWYRKEPPPREVIRDWLVQRREQPWHARGLLRAIDTLQVLATHAGEQGEFSASLRLLARATSQRRTAPQQSHDEPDAFQRADPEAVRMRIQRGFRDLVEVGAVTSNKPLSVRQDRFRGGYFQRGLHWAEDSVVITVNEELRAPAERRSARDLYESVSRSGA